MAVFVEFESVVLDYTHIKKAYRKKALLCHPDKHPDDPIAAERWEQLSKALEILTDKKARAAYDKVLKAKKAAELRNRALDAKRKKVKHDLEVRESAARNEKEDAIADARTLEEEIKRLREEGSRQLEEEKKLLKQQLKEDSIILTDQIDTPKLKVKWRCKKEDETNGGYNHDVLFQIFSKYGNVSNLIMSRKHNGSAIVEFKSKHSAELAVQHEVGKTINPLRVSWLSGKPTKQSVSTNQQSTNISAGFSSDATGGDFESMVLEKLRQAASQNRTEGRKEEQESTHSTETLFNDTDTVGEEQTKNLSCENDFESVVQMRMRQANERQLLIDKLKQEDSD
ncbi:dnaJ homolog subfamily C member 17-like [Saccoglossus kowalevskii]|uniref:DnaJ homolog subfamily C member 17-like n=1 Tax=Saccoglossus kowalevskii TaxID=10224 RepID=A0ABM0GL88_SACKO|nr:PREDICTED: dnaJ homolog subfamily C member 17-like [Saccoglossus kowalevskii]